MPDKVLNKIVLIAIRSLVPDFGRLRLVKNTSEDKYVTWSVAASIMADASKFATIEGRSAGVRQ